MNTIALKLRQVTTLFCNTTPILTVNKLDNASPLPLTHQKRSQSRYFGFREGSDCRPFKPPYYHKLLAVKEVKQLHDATLAEYRRQLNIIDQERIENAVKGSNFSKYEAKK